MGKQLQKIELYFIAILISVIILIITSSMIFLTIKSIEKNNETRKLIQIYEDGLISEIYPSSETKK